jgi:hypothetical protein
MNADAPIEAPVSISRDALREAQMIAIWLRAKLEGPDGDEFKLLLSTDEGREEIVRRARASEDEMRAAIDRERLAATLSDFLAERPPIPPPILPALVGERTDRAYRRQQWQKARKRGAGYTR